MMNKWDRIYSCAELRDYPAAAVLVDNAFLLPESGTALDLASGLGSNALFLAERGFDTQAWDQSGVAMEKLQRQADFRNLPVKAMVKNICNEVFINCAFDVIIVSRFLNRELAHAIIAALNPDALLFYQTYTREKTTRKGPGNPDFLLAENELLRMFSPLRIVYYRENGRFGDISHGLRNEAQLIAAKRSFAPTT